MRERRREGGKEGGRMGERERGGEREREIGDRILYTATAGGKSRHGHFHPS